MEAKEIKKRSDRSKKILDRKEKSETVVKSTLLKYLQGNVDTKKKVVSAIGSRVEAYSKRMNLASLAISEMLKELFNGVKDVRHVQIPNILDQTFIRQSILGTQDATEKNPFIERFYQQHPEYLKVSIRHSGDRNIYSFGAQKYITNLKNSLNVPFNSRVWKFATEYSKVHGLSDLDKKVIAYSILGWAIPKHFGPCFPLNRHITQTIKYHQQVLEFGDQTPSKNYQNVVKYYALLNRFKEKYKFPSFNIVPICRMARVYMEL
jgi:hypothetical protein